MRNKGIILVLIFVSFSCGKPVYNLKLNVDLSAQKKELIEKPVGINLFMLLDDDEAEYRKIPMWQALTNLGVKSVRFNEGEYGDWYLFTHPDSVHLLTKPNAPLYPYLIDIKSKKIDGQLTDINTAPSYPGYPLNLPGYRKTIDFNDFLEMCKKAGATDPTIIIPTHPMNWNEAKPFYPSRNDMIKMAACWVDYANNVMKSGIRFWEIGNEHYWENKNDAKDTEWAKTCAAMALEMAKAMKKVDPTIEVGVNGFTKEWLGTLFAYEDSNGKLIDYIDYVIPHQYAKPEIIGTYQKYLETGEYGLHEVDEAIKAINEESIPDINKREAMKIEVTETSAFMAGSPALLVDNVAWVALANFEHLGYVISAEKVGYAHFWITHWTNDKTYWSALNMDNTIAPMGWGIKLWNDYLRNTIWKADLTHNQVRCYASSDNNGKGITLFIVNKSTKQQNTTINIEGLDKMTTSKVNTLYASNPEASSFTFKKGELSSRSDKKIEVKLKPLSITIIELDK